MVIFANWKEELAATQSAADELMQQIAAGTVASDEHTLTRLEKLATACARLAYGANSPASLTEPVHNLVTWCDHLNEPTWRASFITALQSYPLGSPWQRT
jgi:hypothetical protein